MITLTREEAQQVLDALDNILDKLSEDCCDEYSLWEQYQIAADVADDIRARLSAPEPEYRNVVIKGDLWRIEFLPDHAASVVLVRANYEPKPVPCPVAWKDAAIRLGEELSSVGPDGYYDMTPQQWLDWALNQQPRGKNSLPEPPCKTGSQCIGGKCPQCVVSEPVAWMNESDMGRTDWKVWAHGKPTATMPLYTAPSQREWQGLTDEEYEAMAEQHVTNCYFDTLKYAKAIELKIKERNNG